MPVPRPVPERQQQDQEDRYRDELGHERFVGFYDRIRGGGKNTGIFVVVRMPVVVCDQMQIQHMRVFCCITRVKVV